LEDKQTYQKKKDKKEESEGEKTGHSHVQLKLSPKSHEQQQQSNNERESIAFQCKLTNQKKRFSSSSLLGIMGLLVCTFSLLFPFIHRFSSRRFCSLLFSCVCARGLMFSLQSNQI